MWSWLLTCQHGGGGQNHIKKEGVEVHFKVSMSHTPCSDSKCTKITACLSIVCKFLFILSKHCLLLDYSDRKDNSNKNQARGVYIDHCWHNSFVTISLTKEFVRWQTCLPCVGALQIWRVSCSDWFPHNICTVTSQV